MRGQEHHGLSLRERPDALELGAVVAQALRVALRVPAADQPRHQVDRERAVGGGDLASGSRPLRARRAPRCLPESGARAARHRRETPGARGCPRARSAEPCSARRAGGVRRARARARPGARRTRRGRWSRRSAPPIAWRQRSRSSLAGAGSPATIRQRSNSRRGDQALAHRVRVARVAAQQIGQARAALAVDACAAATRRAAARAADRPARRASPRASASGTRRARRRDGGMSSASHCAPPVPSGRLRSIHAQQEAPFEPARRVEQEQHALARAFGERPGRLVAMRVPRRGRHRAILSPWRGSERIHRHLRERPHPDLERALVEHEARRVVGRGVGEGRHRAGSYPRKKNTPGTRSR